MNKINLKDCTFLIPFFYDHEDRLENLEFLIDYLNHHFDTNIFVGECCERSMLQNHPVSNKISKYFYWFSESDLFHRTKVLNLLCKEANTKIVVNQDTDVIFPKEAYTKARDLIVNNIADIVYPYDGNFMEMLRSKLSILKQTMDFFSIPKQELNCCHPNSKGGAVFENREKFIDVGMENEHFRSWSFEDNERWHRFHVLGLRVSRLENYLLHIEHWRGKNSNPHHEHYNLNLLEYNRIANMSKENVLEEIKTWSWL